MSGTRILIVASAVAALAAAFVLLRPEDDDVPAPPTVEPIATTTQADTGTAETRPQPARIDVTVRGGRPVGGIVRARAREGDPVVVVVRSDVADHVHVHGYDLMADVGPGSPARIEFRASLTGRFEIELEDRGRQIAQLTVVP